jgi:site-specific recombinase XerD
MLIPKHTEIFVKEMERRGYSPNTVVNYTSNIQMFFNFFQKKEHPLHINETDVKEYLGRFEQPNTQRSHHGAIKLYYNICLWQKEKFKYIPYVKKEKKLPIVLSVEEIQRMFDVCENLKHKVILALLYSCSLRVSELINLKWQHIDRSRMVINIIQAKGKKDRQVGLNDKLIQLLTEYYKQYKSIEYVLNGQGGNPQYSKESVLQVVKNLADKAGIKNKRVYTHLIRHCSATHMVENGIDLNLIQRLLGHSSIKTTAIYAHISHNLISHINSPLNAIQL